MIKTVREWLTHIASMSKGVVEKIIVRKKANKNNTKQSIKQ